MKSSIWLNFTVYAVIIVLLLGLITILIISNSYVNRTRRNLRDLGNEVVETIEDYSYILQDDESALMRTIGVYLGGVEATEYVRIYIFDGEDSALIYPVASRYDDFNDYIDEETSIEMFERAVSEYKNGGGDSYVLYSTDSSMLSYASWIDVNDAGVYVILQSSMRVMNSTVNAVIIYVVIICVLAIIAAVIISYFLSSRLSGPINSITQSAMELGKGNYDVKFASAQYAEVAQLSDTLNFVTCEVKKSDDLQKQLMANVSHDLKTPLTMIKAYASMIKEISGDDPEKRNKDLDIIINETDRLTDMINDVLQVSRIGTESKLNLKIFNLTDFLYGIIDRFGYLQETQGYSIMVDIDPDIYTIADEEKMRQVIYNLVSNAVNYTGEDKTVYVSLKENVVERRVFFSVRDTGNGIAPEDIPHIWDRYYRKQENHLRPIKGTGLGLNIVKLILEQHKFSFGVDSKPGEGSTFWVEFPSVDEDAEPEAAEVDTGL